MLGRAETGDGVGEMVTTASPRDGATGRYGCVLCGRRFALPPGRPTLPAHAYPGGLYRGRPCASRYGVRL